MHVTDANQFFGLALGKTGLTRVHEGGGGNRRLYHLPRDIAVAAEGGAGGADGATAFATVDPLTLVSLPVDCDIISVGCALLLGIWAAAPRGNAFRGIEEARRLYSGVSGRSLPSLHLESFPYFIESLCWHHLRIG